MNAPAPKGPGAFYFDRQEYTTVTVTEYLDIEYALLEVASDEAKPLEEQEKATDQLIEFWDKWELCSGTVRGSFCTWIESRKFQKSQAALLQRSKDTLNWL